MPKNSDPASLLLSRLQAPDGPWPARVSELLINFALGLPVATLVRPEEIALIVSEVLAESSIGTATGTHVKPAWHRQQERARAANDTVGDALPKAAVAAIEQIIQRGEAPRFAWLKGAVDPKLMAQLIAPVVQQVLLGFVTKLPGTLGSSSASLMGMLGRGVQQRASALADVGKAMMGGIGVDVEKKLQTAAKDFSQSATSTIRDALHARLASSEGQGLVQQIGTQVFAHIRATPVCVIQDDIARLPIDEIIDLVPTIVAHNRGRALIHEVIREEVDAALVAIGEQTIGDLLTTYGLRGQVEAIAKRVVPPTLANFFSDQASATLVRELLTPGE